MAFLNPGTPVGRAFRSSSRSSRLGTGGITARGLMDGVQKLFYCPRTHDFIYGVIARNSDSSCELPPDLLCVITWRGLRIALQAPDACAACPHRSDDDVAIQLHQHERGTRAPADEGIPPAIHQPGGSSMMVTLMGMGVLLNVSQHAAT